jgi:phage I-like protein
LEMLILNRDFEMPVDGFYQIAPLGEFPHACAGVIQVIDEEACVAMAARFAADAAVAHFAGLLIDFDHFSMQGGQRSEAAGWIVALEARTQESGVRSQESEGRKDGAAGTPRPTQSNNGLWAQIRWSDLGEEAVKGGRYRFLSPVWAREDCVDLGNGRVRPVRLLNAAVTNDPNLKGIRPLSNSGQETGDRSQKEEQSGAGSGQGVENRPSDRGGCRRDEGGDLSSRGGSADGGRLELSNREIAMKSVIEKLVNHLGLAVDATEAVILEKMAGLPGLTVVAELQNSLSAARTELDALKGTLKGVEGELVNRHLEEFAGVVTEKTKEFWAGQLMANRAGALAALEDLATGREAGREEPTPTPSKEGNKEGSRKPLHNRATARPVIPGQGAGGAEGDSKAVKIRNRAHELVAAEKIPFGVAFRRAEKEVVGQ